MPPLGDDPQNYLPPGPCIDSDHPQVVTLAASLTRTHSNEIDNAVALYYWVRDAIRYNPYALDTTRDALRASATLAAGEAWCVPKAVLLAALCRASGIPARPGFADVRNHLSTARLRAQMNSDVFHFHGYCSIFIGGQWVKATPAFNIELCSKFGLQPLEFDGMNDSLYHEFDCAGNRHMEYIRERGEYFDVPFEEMMALFREKYPAALPQGDGAALDRTLWAADVEREVG